MVAAGGHSHMPHAYFSSASWLLFPGNRVQASRPLAYLPICGHQGNTPGSCVIGPASKRGEKALISSTHVDDLARRLVELGGSDLHLKAGVPRRCGYGACSPPWKAARRCVPRIPKVSC